MKDLLLIAFSLFILIDAIGNIPFFLAFLKRIDPKKHRKIILREMLIALAIIVFFNFVGQGLLDFLHVQENTVQIAGGIILFILSLQMIFPSSKNHEVSSSEEPFIVPLAIPLIAGPGILSAVMLYSHNLNHSTMLGAIALAWGVSVSILLFAPFLGKKLKAKGLLAIERLMGLILVLLAVQMFLSGLSSFLKIP